MDLPYQRDQFSSQGLLEADTAADPLVQFDRWYEQVRASGYHQPEAMVVATVDGVGRPSCRFVLLRGHGPDGFVFFTDRESAKGCDLAASGEVALLFPWQEVGRQIRVRGRAELTDDDRSDAYWRSRPRGSRLAATSSHQSRPVADRPTLDAAYDATIERFPDGTDIPRPARWGGYLVVPDEYEFWQQREHRFHDRLRFRRVGEAWVRERLQP